MNGDRVEIDAPGLDVQRGDLRWRASREAITRGYKPKNVAISAPLTIRLAPDAIHITGARQALDRVIAECARMTAEMQDWLGEPAGASRDVKFEKTLASLVDIFKSHSESPYNVSIGKNTRDSYDSWCSRLCADGRGTRRIDKLTGLDMRRWFNDILKPATPTAPPRPIMARRCVKVMMPILLAFGAELSLPGCAELHTALEKADIRAPAKTMEAWRKMRPQGVPMTFAQAEAIVAAGLARGTVRHRSLALGVAAQFELTLSQIDLVGLYEKIAPGAVPSDAVVKRGKLWDGGLRYGHFLPDMILDTRRHKTGRPGVYDVREHPLFMRALAAVPEDERAGPVVVDDDGLPMDRYRYGDLYRELADEAGVPRDVWNMKARNGGASEASDSGATDEEVANLLRNDPETARGFYIHASITQNRKVARMRVAARQRKTGTDE